MLSHEIREPRQPQRKEHRPFEGKRITPQLPCHPHPPRYKPKPDSHHKQSTEVDTFRTLLTKRDRHKESQSKLQVKPHRRVPCEPREERPTHKKESSKSRSRSKGLNQSKSMKQLGKKNPRREVHREERKSQSPPFHTKSTTSHGERRNCKSHYNSKTTRQMVSELTTDRDKCKPKQPKVTKKPKSEINKKPSSKPRKKSQKQNIKVDARSKPKKALKKTTKHVLISEEHSKIRRDGDQWQQSLNQDEFLNPKEPKAKSKGKRSNIVEIPKRKQRLSLNGNHPRRAILKNKTETQHENHQYIKQEFQNHAATKIQKVFRGYLTRKYIQECFEHNAAIKIQKVYRGYKARQKFKMMKAHRLQQIDSSPGRELRRKILQQDDYLLQRSSSDVKNSMMNQKWASFLEEILSEQSVSENIKKKIEFFLQNQQKSFQEFDPLQDLRSPSARSSISSQIINNEIDSERKFIQKMKKGQSFDQQPFLSPKQYSPNGLQPSPQHLFCSPQHRLSHSSAKSSTEMLIVNLKNIQKVHKLRLQNKASNEKEELNDMLIRHKLSPRTHEKMFKEVDLMLENQLSKFNESINEIVKNCMVYGQEQEEVDEDPLSTPKKELTQLPMPGDISPHHQPIKGEQMSVQFRQYYEHQKLQIQPQKEQQLQPFDTSYHFIEEYLISLIDYVRQYDGGMNVAKVLACLHKSKSHEMDIIIKNSKLITEGSEDQEENSFRLPMYKYIDLEEPVFQEEIVEEFNAVFPKLQGQELGSNSNLAEHFLKMVVESMNEALNALRPQNYPFVESKLSSVNVLKNLEKIPFECESSEEQMHYQFVCAQALNKIFYWNRLEWGRVIRLHESQETYFQNKMLLEKEMETSLLQIHAQEDWHFYEELIEIIGLLGQDLFEDVILQEIAAIWGMVMDWNIKTGKMPILIETPDGKDFYQP